MSTRLNYDAMSAGVLDAALAKLGLPAPTQKTIPARASVLKKHFAELEKGKDGAPKVELLKCSNCKGESTEDLDACPYCGDSETSTGPAVIEATAEPVVEIATQSGGYVQVHASDLDAALTNIRTYKKNAERCLWELATEIKRVHDEELWKARIIEGKPEHKTWKVFCAKELGMSHTNAYSLIQVAEKFTREQMESLGYWKLAILVSVPEEKRTPLLAGAAGDTTRELQAKADAAKGTTKTPAALSVMTRVNAKVTLPMTGSNNKGKPATELADDPWCEEQHDNGVVTRYVVKLDPKSKAVVLLITRRRA
jgi:hypothetical protein